MLELFVISLFLGQLGAVWGEILSAPGFLFDPYIKLIDKLPDWLKKPLGFCSYCMIGQIAVWLFICLSWGDYNAISHVFFVANSIFFVDIFNKMLRYGN